MENNWKGTKLPVSLMGNQVYSDNKTIGDFENDRLPKLETIENARLFHNALNTIYECGLMPSELKSQRDELLEFVRILLTTDNIIEQSEIKIAKELIKKIKG